MDGLEEFQRLYAQLDAAAARAGHAIADARMIRTACDATHDRLSHGGGEQPTPSEARVDAAVAGPGGIG